MKRGCLIVLALLFLLWFAGSSSWGQFNIDLYKDGQLVDTLATSASVPDHLPKPSSVTRVASSSSQSLAVPTVSEETQQRNQLFAESARIGVEIQEELRRMRSAAAQGFAPQTAQLAELFQQFLAVQEQARAAYTSIGNQVLQLNLPSEIFERHLDTMAAFKAGLTQFSAIVHAVLRGKPGALENALAFMKQVKFRREPDLTKAGPTRVPMQRLEAPVLTRDAADALLQAEAKEAEANAVARGFVPVPAPASTPTPDDLAETPDVQWTPEIRAKAAALGNSPYAIYNFVRNKVAFQPYLGSRKGAHNTLRQLAGNDTDQASLLLALLRAAGIPSRYVRGSVEMTPEQAKTWLGVDDAWTAGTLLTTAGLNGVNIISGTHVVAIRCSRVWVEAFVPYLNYRGAPNDDTGKTWIPLDPAFKETMVAQGEDVLAAMSYNHEVFLANYVSTYNTNSPIEQLELGIQSWLNTNRPGQQVADIARNIATQPQDLGLLPASLPVELLSASSPFSALAKTNRFEVRFHLYDGAISFIDFTTNLSALAGHQVTIHYIGATPACQATLGAFGGVFQTPPHLVQVKPVLKVDGTPVATSVHSIGLGCTHSSDMYFIQPRGGQNVQPVIYNDIIAGNSQAIAFDTFMDKPQVLLADTNSSPGSFLIHLLQTTGLEYLSRVDRAEEKADRLLRTVHIVDVSEAIVENSVSVTCFWTGVPQTFTWTGLTVDADRRIVGPFGADGGSAQHLPFMLLTGYDGSFVEHDVIEDLYGQRAVSAVRILQLSRDQGIPLCHITNSLSRACPGFNHSSSTSIAVNNALANGRLVIIPQRSMTIDRWSATGYIDMDPLTGAAGYIISGGPNGTVTVAGGSTIGTGTKQQLSPKTSCPVTVSAPNDTPLTFDFGLAIADDSGSFSQPWHINTGYTTRSLADRYGCGDYTLSVSADGRVQSSSTFKIEDGCPCPTPLSDEDWSDLKVIFPNLYRCHTCPVGPVEPTYNCLAWAIGDTNRWVWDEADANRDGLLAVAELDAFLGSKGVSGIAYFGPSTGNVVHVARKTAGVGTSCGATSKLGRSVLLSHHLNELTRGWYHGIVGGN